jgi:ribulose-5-phosphate 4-epimerase/fuculose-1-phosphate aldolase
MSNTQTYPLADVEPYGTARSVEDERAHRLRTCALGYRIFGALRWGLTGDGHISARDPELTDHFWLLDHGIPFRLATSDSLVLVAPDGTVVERGARAALGDVNTAGYHIHTPVLQARPDAVSIAHTHTPYGTPWSANVELFRPITQESTAFVFDQALFDDEEVEVLTLDGGRRIAQACGQARLCILRNHGLLTIGATVEEAVGFFVMAERVAEAHVKAPNSKPISHESARLAADSIADPRTGWRAFQWLVRDLVPDQSLVD